MKHLIILGDGMADHPIAALGGRTPLEAAHTPAMDDLARQGINGRLQTIPHGFHPGSEVANTAILGYDLRRVYEGRGPLEAASIGYQMQPGDLALRCNIISTQHGRILNHHGGHLTTEEGQDLIRFINKQMGFGAIQLIPGIQYRHLLIVHGGSKHIITAPPHDHPGEPVTQLLPHADPAYRGTTEPGRMSPEDTAALLTQLIKRSESYLLCNEWNRSRPTPASCLWPWGGGYRPQMLTLEERYPQVKRAAVISAVDLIRGIGRYAGMEVIHVEGATGLADTNYEGKAQAALEALEQHDFVYLHIEASDEAGHDGDLQLKMRTIENLDRRIVSPIISYIKEHQMSVCVALLPDHPTPVELRTHVAEPVPVTIWYPGCQPDDVERYDEQSAVNGRLQMMYLQEFMQTFMNI